MPNMKPNGIENTEVVCEQYDCKYAQPNDDGYRRWQGTNCLAWWGSLLKAGTLGVWCNVGDAANSDKCVKFKAGLCRVAESDDDYRGWILAHDPSS